MCQQYCTAVSAVSAVFVQAAYAPHAYWFGNLSSGSSGPFLPVLGGTFCGLPLDSLESPNMTFRRCEMPGNNDNRANQLNPNNDAYWSSRGETRPS